MTGRRRGAKTLTARDWLFGSRPRRLVLRFVLDSEAPKEGWTKSDIALACGLSKNGGATPHVEGLAALGVLEERDGRYRPRGLDNSLVARVAELVHELESVPDVTLDALRAGDPRRSAASG
jgi:hypothetical protein